MKDFCLLFVSITALSCIMGTLRCNAQSSAPQSGKIYRIVNPCHDNVAMCEDYSSHTLRCGEQGENYYNQLWVVETQGEGYTIQNVYTGRYIQYQTGASKLFSTSESPSTVYVTKNVSAAGSFNIKGSLLATSGLHCNSSFEIVSWSCTTTADVSATEWLFYEDTLSAEEMRNARNDYEMKLNILENEELYDSLALAYFTDASCSNLKAEYTGMSDEELSTTMNGMPKSIIEIALKIKNDAWGKREKEFRIHSYEPYSDPDAWSSILYTNKYSLLNNPTGIYANANDILFVFVESDVPSDAALSIEGVMGASVRGTTFDLKKGLNIVPVSMGKAMQYIRYTAHTTEEKCIADFKAIKIHIEGGIVNGYFDKHFHSDSDWIDISRNLATHEMIEVKGDKVLLNMHRSYVMKACPETITDAIGFWDKLVTWEQSLMGIDDVCPSKFNNLMLCISGDGGNPNACDYRTYFPYNNGLDILPWSSIYSKSKGCWCAAHEIGHMNQKAINMISCTEVSNNLFSNVAVYKIGKYTTRGPGMSSCYNSYVEGIPYTKRSDVFSKTRMYFQLYLYYHAAKNDTLFYPKLFKLLREDPLIHNKYTSATDDQLKFAEKCCEAAGEDLSEFFEVWGFFVPMDKEYVGDYNMYYLTATKDEIDASKKRMSKYEKKNGNIIFIDDHIAKSKRIDGIEGDRLDYNSEVAIGTVGDVGEWEDYVNAGANVTANGYSYYKSGTQIKIIHGKGAIGFKVYDEEGNLLCVSNTYTFTLPTIAFNKRIQVVAAQANGKDVRLSSACTGNEAMQIEALNAVISAADSYLAKIDSSGTRVGCYYPNGATLLWALCDSAKMAEKQKDQSIHSYGEWSLLLDSVLDVFLSNNANEIQLKPMNYYKLINNKYPNYALALRGTSLCCSQSTVDNGIKIRWSIIEGEDKGVYYIKNENGNYITTLLRSTIATATSSKEEEALPFSITEEENGSYYLTAQNESAQCLHCNARLNVVGWDKTADASHWSILLTDNLFLDIQLKRLDSLINVATQILNELIHTTEVEDTNSIVFLPNIYSDNMELLVSNTQSLIVLREESKAARGNLTDYTTILSKIEQAINLIKGSYSIMPDYPLASDAHEVTWYYIKNIDNGLYCSLDTIGTRYKYCIPLEELQEEEKSFWWCFIPTGLKNEFYIYNYMQGSCIYNNSNIYLRCEKGHQGMGYVVSLSNENLGFVISNNGYNWYWGNYARIAQMSSYWTFEKIVTEKNDCLSSIHFIVKEKPDSHLIYDLQGNRHTETDRNGLFIVDGKKMWLKP